MCPNIWFLAIFLRLALLLYGEWQDHALGVPYTDVDYIVCSDAAAAVVHGGSPYERATYRYTPLLAYLLAPNILLHASFGKLLYSCSDLAVGALISAICSQRRTSTRQLKLCVGIWVLNPLVANISSRGSCDTLVGFLILAVIYLLHQRRTAFAAAVYGLAVHFRIYPIFFAPSLLLFLNADYCFNGDGEVFKGAHRQTKKPNPPPPPPLQRYRVIQTQATFTVVSAGIFFGLFALFYALYGWEFAYETYFYHLSRTDNRHNFSVFFYDLYLRYGQSSGILVGLAALLPQLGLQSILSLVLARDLSFCLCVQTMAFVAFNKVITAQYFLWYLPLLPLVLPSTTLRFRWRGMMLIFTWFVAELHWLFWAYRLEYLGENTFLQVWSASMIFFMVNVTIIAILIRAHRLVPLFLHGELQHFPPEMHEHNA